MRVQMVPDGVVVQLAAGDRDGRVYRAEAIEETFTNGAYDLWVTGPIVTKVGRDHSTHRGGRFFETQELPVELRDLLVGEQGLRDLLAEAARGGAE